MNKSSRYVNGLESIFRKSELAFHLEENAVVEDNILGH